MSVEVDDGSPDFICVECGRGVYMIASPIPDPHLCVACMTVPGWMADPRLCQILDADNHRQPPDLAALPLWSPKT